MKTSTIDKIYRKLFNELEFGETRSINEVWDFLDSQYGHLRTKEDVRTMMLFDLEVSPDSCFWGDLGGITEKQIALIKKDRGVEYSKDT